MQDFAISMQIADEKKPADQAGLGCPANRAGLYVGAQQTFGTTFGEATFLQAIRTTFGEATFLQAIRTAFSQATFLQTIRATFGNAGFYQAVRAAFGDYRVGKSVCSEYRESEAKQELAFHDGVLRVSWLGAVWHGFDVTRWFF